MTLDELISKLLEAKEHCVPGNTKVKIWFTDTTSLSALDKLKGCVYSADYDNEGVNIYYDYL